MPTYQYRCTSCQHEFEELQRISDEALKTCPSCKKETLVRIIGGGAGLVFKGSGFYQTDYKKSEGTSKPTKSSTESKPAKDSAGSNKESGPKSETTSESKPDPKSESAKPSSSQDSGGSKPKGESKD